jgi:hypothetical protein
MSVHLEFFILIQGDSASPTYEILLQSAVVFIHI